MQSIMKLLRAGMLFACLLFSPVWAAMPDPVEFAWAVENNNQQKVKGWLDEGLDPEFQGSQIGNGLMIAAWHGNIPMMALFVERGANPRRVNQNGEQALQLAAWNGHLEAVQWLLDHGATINRSGNDWGALHYAVFNGHTELAQFLIGRGAEINAKSPNGSTPLMMAAREGREDLVKTLLDAGADVKARNDWGDNALTFAMRYDHYRLGKMISSAEEFAVAVQAPKESFGKATRSTAAPSEIEVLLKNIREAEAAGQPSDELRKKLMQVVDTLRQNAKPIKSARHTMPLPNQPKSIVITARRGQTGAERAQIVTHRPDASLANKKPLAASSDSPPAKSRMTASQIADLTRQIRLAEAQGQAVDDLRKRLYEAVEQMK